MILGIGTDIVDSRRISSAIDRFSVKFLSRIFTIAERELAQSHSNKDCFFAKRFAAKEAVYKALSGSGVSGLGWQHAEVLSHTNGAPNLQLTERCKTALETITPDGYKAFVSLSLSDEPPYALAFVVISASPTKLEE